jgi:hypothetical protein
MRRVVLVGLLLAGCSSGSSHDTGPKAFDVAAVCALADVPHTTPAELKALHDRAHALTTGTSKFVGTAKERQVYEAGLVISIQATVAEKLASSSAALQSAVPGIAGTLDDALESLRDTCGG